MTIETITEVRHWISYALEYTLLVLIIAWSMSYLARTGHFFRAVLRMWLGLICSYVFLCVILPLAILAVSDDQHVADFFPDARGVVGIVFVGWLPALLFCAVAGVCRACWLSWQRMRFKQRPPAVTTSE